MGSSSNRTRSPLIAAAISGAHRARSSSASKASASNFIFAISSFSRAASPASNSIIIRTWSWDCEAQVGCESAGAATRSNRWTRSISAPIRRISFEPRARRRLAFSVSWMRSAIGHDLSGVPDYRRGPRPNALGPSMGLRSEKKGRLRMQSPFLTSSRTDVTASKTEPMPERSRWEQPPRPYDDDERRDDAERKPSSWRQWPRRGQPLLWHRWPPALRGWQQPEPMRQPAEPSGWQPQRERQPGQRDWRHSLRAAPDRARWSSLPSTKGLIQPRLTQPVCKIS